MQPPMLGSWSVRIEAVKPFTIHGDLYYELQAVRTNDPQGQAFVLKVPQHATLGEPAVGQILLVKFLMGQVTEAKPVQGGNEPPEQAIRTIPSPIRACEKLE